MIWPECVIIECRCKRAGCIIAGGNDFPSVFSVFLLCTNGAVKVSPSTWGKKQRENVQANYITVCVCVVRACVFAYAQVCVEVRERNKSNTGDKKQR